MFVMKGRMCFLNNLRTSSDLSRNYIDLIKYYSTTASLNQNRPRHHRKEITKSDPQKLYNTVKGKDSELPYKVIDPHDSRLT